MARHYAIKDFFRQMPNTLLVRGESMSYVRGAI